MNAVPDIIEPLDDFFRALMRAHDFHMMWKAAEASRQAGPKEPNNHERHNAKRPDDHD